MYYYEIGFYGEGHEKDWTFYIKSEKPLTDQEITEKLQNEFLGVDGLEQHHIDNIDCIHEITAEEFTKPIPRKPMTSVIGMKWNNFH